AGNSHAIRNATPLFPLQVGPPKIRIRVEWLGPRTTLLWLGCAAALFLALRNDLRQVIKTIGFGLADLLPAHFAASFTQFERVSQKFQDVSCDNQPRCGHTQVAEVHVVVNTRLPGKVVVVNEVTKGHKKPEPANV